MSERLPPHLSSAAAAVLGALDAFGIRACLIGGMVISRWGQPRATSDVDVSVLAPYGDEDRIIDILVARFQPRIADARQFALDRRVLLLQTAEGGKVDAALAAVGFEIGVLDL